MSRCCVDVVIGPPPRFGAPIAASRGPLASDGTAPASPPDWAPELPSGSAGRSTPDEPARSDPPEPTAAELRAPSPVLPPLCAIAAVSPPEAVPSDEQAARLETQATTSACLRRVTQGN